MKRVLTAAALIPAVVYVVLWGPLWLLYTVVAAVSILCYREYDGIAGAYGFGAPGPVGYGAGILLLAARPEGLPLAIALTLLALALAMRAGNLSHSLPRAALLVTGVLYIFGSFGCAVPLREANPHWLMHALLVSWIGDTGAYYAGRALGRHKMAPRISPGKSWEGAVASVLTATVAGTVYLAVFLPGIGWPEAALLSAALNVAGQAGDLAESAMKRGARVKDSGTLLPGHGGFLDRVDSTLFALPAAYLYLRFLHA